MEGAAAAVDAGAAAGGGDAPVVTAKVGERDVPIDLAAIGNVEAFVSNSVRSQVTGTLVEVAFREGDVVKQGQLLFQLDRRPFEAALAQAEANLTRDKALLAQAEAQLSRDASNAEYQQLTAERQAQLTQRGIISKDQAEQARAAADATAGTVKADKANIESARAQLVAQDAAVANARVQLGYTTIRSPIDGQTGSLAVKVGGLVTANQTELMTIARVQPVYVTFTVPAIHLATIKQPQGRRRPCRHRGAAGRRPAGRHRRARLRRQRRRHDDGHDQAEGDVSESGSPPVARPVRARRRCGWRRCRTPSWCRSRRCRPGRTASTCSWSSPIQPSNSGRSRPDSAWTRIW